MRHSDIRTRGRYQKTLIKTRQRRESVTYPPGRCASGAMGGREDGREGVFDEQVRSNWQAEFLAECQHLGPVSVTLLELDQIYVPTRAKSLLVSQCTMTT